MNIRELTTAGGTTAHINLSLADLAPDEALDQPAGGETVAVVLTGSGDVAVDGASLGLAGGRSSVFEAAGDAVYVPPGATMTVTAHGDAPVQLAITEAAADPTPDAPPARIIRPEDQRIAEVGHGNWSRTVRTILGPEHTAVRLLVGETINPPGNWSSYPPHRHDRNDPPREVNLEEVYLFKVDPPEGFGVQIRYDLGGAQEAFLVRDDDLAVIRSGFHPVVAASGYALYYLWVMAGDGRVMMPYLDPAHAWVQEAA
jgi:5-deoxy-glucuronate isomerase